MAGLTNHEIRKIVNRYIGVFDGYLSNFSYRTHTDFYPDYCDLEIDPNEYEGTTRDRFISILQNSPPNVQAKIVRGVLQRFPLDATEKIPSTRTKDLHDDLLNIAERIESESSIEEKISLSIEGPSSIPIGKISYYTVISKNAVKATWSIGGFNNNNPISVDPLGPSHQIFVEPTDCTRVGEDFTIAFTAYDSNGRSETTLKKFTLLKDLKTDAEANLISENTSENSSLITMKSNMDVRIFLAHASEDKAAVVELYERLKHQGYKPWLDKKDLLPGQSWRAEIPKAIENSDVFIACLSQSSVAKHGYVQREFKMALNKCADKPPGTIFLIPLRLDDCEIPELRQEEYGVNFRDYQWLDYWESDGFEKLVRAIEWQFNSQN